MSPAPVSPASTWETAGPETPARRASSAADPASWLIACRARYWVTVSGGWWPASSRSAHRAVRSATTARESAAPGTWPGGGGAGDMDKVPYLLRMLTYLSVTHAGLLGVFVLMVPESACIPVPSELTLLAAGFAVHQGRMGFAAAVAAATAGNLAGSLAAYALGRLTSRRRLWARAQAGLRRCDALLARHGAGAVLLARLMPLARTFVSLSAGHARIPIARFTVLTTLGCAIWAAGFVLAGMLLGTGWQQAGHAVRLPLLLLGAAAGAALWWRARGQDR